MGVPAVDCARLSIGKDRFLYFFPCKQIPGKRQSLLGMGMAVFVHPAIAEIEVYPDIAVL